MFQLVALPLLGVEPLIFYLPPHPPAHGHILRLFPVYRQIRDIPEHLPDRFRASLLFPFFIFMLPDLSVFHQVYPVSVVINIRHIIIPGFPVFRYGFTPVLLLLLQYPVFLRDSRDTPLLITQDIPPALFPAFLKEPLTCVQAVRTQADGKTRKLFFQFFHQAPARFSFTVLLSGLIPVFIVHKLRHDAHQNIRMQDQFCFQYIVIVLTVFRLRPPVVNAVQTLPVQFFSAAVQLCPVYDDLPVFSTDTHILKCPAAQQPAAQAVYDILQVARIQPLQVTVDRLPVWQLIDGRFLPAQPPHIFNYRVRIEFLTCFPHAADVK